MVNSIDHFIFVPGIGAGKKHPAGRLITDAVGRLTEGSVTTEFAETCDEVANIIVPHSLEQQAEALADKINRYKGRVALFAHSQGGLPTALALTHFDLPQVDPEDVVLAGTPLDSELARQRTFNQTINNLEIRDHVKGQIGLAHTAVLGVKYIRPHRPEGSIRYIAVTSEHLDSYPTRDDHLSNLAQLDMSTLLISGNETVTDCTPENIKALLPQRTISDNPFDLTAKTIIIKGANHNLKGYCETHVPEILASRIIGRQK